MLLNKMDAGDNLMISGVIGLCGRIIYQKVVDVAQKAVAVIAREVMIVCDRLLTQKLGLETILAKFVRGQMKHNVMANKKNWKRT